MKEHASGSQSETSAVSAREPRAYWLDNPANVERVVWAVYLICALLVLVDVFIHKHGPFSIEHVFGFYAWYGFIACVGLVLLAKVMRRVLMRPEDYYDR